MQIRRAINPYSLIFAIRAAAFKIVNLANPVAGIYIHIPFCKKACHYCNFHFSTHTGLQNDFTGALLKEIEIRKDYLEGEQVETIYFGGGTPSLLPPADLGRILDSIFSRFSVCGTPEITLEANPDDMTLLNLKSWKTLGVNRLSIGLQSFFDEDLVWMNRAHDASQALEAPERAREAGFEHFSIDLIYGFPLLGDEKWGKNLHRAIKIRPDHISCYALTVENRTALDKMIRNRQSPPIDPERQASQFLSGIRILEAAGYEHYEISSFALPGKRSRHNSAYWSSKKYMGLGPSAHSFNGSGRQWNISNNALYIKYLAESKSFFDTEILRPIDRINEYIMTSLRTREGLDLSYIMENHGSGSREKLELKARPYILNRQMEKKEKKLVLTTEGKLFADGIAAALFFD